MINSIQHIVIILAVILTQTGIDLNQRIIYDETLIVPGIGAEKIILNESISQLNDSYKGQEYRLVKLKEQSEIFTAIYKININTGLVFNEIRYYYNNNTVAFIKNNIIQAVVGLKMDRITVDAVDLSRGAEFFIYHYGNESMKVYEESSGILYMYQNKGIAIFDDNNDDTIDLYMVFPPQKK